MNLKIKVLIGVVEYKVFESCFCLGIIHAVSHFFTMLRYIEIFKSSLQEIRLAVGMSGPKMRPLIPNRPGPYDRSDRFGGMMNRYAMGRGRNFRGNIYFPNKCSIFKQ